MGLSGCYGRGRPFLFAVQRRMVYRISKERLMRKNVLRRNAALAIGCVLLLCACSQPATSATASLDTAQATPEEAGHYPVTITNYDFAGEEISYTYSQAPERVIAVYQGSIETMIA